MKIENDLGRDDIRRLVLRLAIPSMLAQFMNVLYSVVRSDAPICGMSR